jgi:hypothetical protein
LTLAVVQVPKLQTALSMPRTSQRVSSQTASHFGGASPSGAAWHEQQSERSWQSASIVHSPTAPPVVVPVSPVVSPTVVEVDPGPVVVVVVVVPVVVPVVVLVVEVESVALSESLPLSVPSLVEVEVEEVPLALCSPLEFLSGSSPAVSESTLKPMMQPLPRVRRTIVASDEVSHAARRRVVMVRVSPTSPELR